MTASDLFGLAGQVAVVTGGSRGIGRAIAAGFAEAGADVVIASRKLGNCTAAAAEISASTGRTALPVEFHAGHWADCDRLIDTVYREFGRCDVLVSNAGMSPLYPDLASVTEEYYDKVHGVNLKGPFRLGVLAGTRMAGAGGGSIINISSIGSLRPGADELVYACAKAGLNALTIGLADAFGPRVRAKRDPSGCGPHRCHPGVAGRQAAQRQRGRAPRPAGPAPGSRRDGTVAGQPRVGVGDRRHGAGRWRLVPADQLTSNLRDGTARRRRKAMIDFTIPEDIKQTRARVAAFIDAHVLPAEAEIGTRPYLSIVADLQARARATGLWCPFVPAEWGGMGLGHLGNAIVQIEVGRSPLAAWAMNCLF